MTANSNITVNLNRRQNGFLFAAGAAAVAAGLLFPMSAHILDVFLVLGIFLTAAVLIIAFAAKEILDVRGYPLFIVFTAALRMALCVACAKLIVSGNGGDIIGFLSRPITDGNLTLTVSVFGMLAIVIWGILCKSVKNIARISAEFISDIAPLRQLCINNNLKAGVISKNQALDLVRRTAGEAGFFVAMSGVAKFMLCEAVVEFVVIIIGIAVSIAMGTAIGQFSDVSAKTYVTSTVGAGLITQISILITAAASGYLVRKNSGSGDPFEQEFRRTIKVTASEVSPQTTELNYSQTYDGELTEIEDSIATAEAKTSEKVITEDLEWLNESQYNGKDKKGNLNLWQCREIESNNGYEPIAELIESKSANGIKTILMAAERTEELPVTIPVNIAVHLAKKNKKCLLIDLDVERKAISKVFDIDDSVMRGKAISTCINNLWVWPAKNFSKVNEIKIRADSTSSPQEVIAALGNRYDYLIVYAPNTGTAALVDCSKIACCVEAAMLFGGRDESEHSFIRDFYELLNGYGCEVLESREMFAYAV